ncbi:PREDICTED: GTPase-activating protein isoform X2 [Nicrophorus vespilloides]|uniref:GTPase-activating protein isoform X2 n=1 Tax=Nicrophorus vespilloides TaxID=110193 RepID=A0ABM1MRP7_NICVS|nr:PREDICTED: GTPase-activating protein isoform X2 [Nicrophorus vespilloides]
MATDDMDVRIEERLKIKIGEAKNLLSRNHGSSVCRDVYCTLSLDQEVIFRTSTIEKTLSPFFGEEFQFEVPRKFRYLSVYLYDRDRHLKQDKVLGKVAIKREELAPYNNKDHWFPIRPVDADSEVQGKANIEIKFEPLLSRNNSTYSSKKRLSVRVIECLDLTLKNGSCDPYALITVVYTNEKKVTKRTKVRKKTTCPQFDEIFQFDNYEDRDRDKDTYTVCPESEVEICELNVSIWHNGMGGDIFLGEVKVQLRGLQQQNAALKNAWYFLQPRSSKNKPHVSVSTPPGTRLSIDNSLGSLRLQVQYTADHVFPAKVYEPLRNLLLDSVNVRPIINSPVYLLGDIVSSKMDVAQPLVRIFMHHEKIVPIIRALADAEISNVTDATTIFRGNTLVSKMMDEAMKMIGIQYLHKTLRPTIEQVFLEKKPCEIDPTRVRDATTIQANLSNLKSYVHGIFRAITESAVHCPALMCQIFDNLKECAMTYFPDNKEVRYSVISGFIFLRFFAPAILGPRLFDLTSEQIDAQTNRTLTLISKTIQSLGNLVSCRSTQQVCKEEYMECVYKEFCTETHVRAVRQFLEIISANSNQKHIAVDTPVTLKEGIMIKRAQGRKRFGRKNFKQRYFKLTTHDLSYSKMKGREPLCQIPLSNILAVERLQEKSFKMKNMFQIVQKERALYVQAANCVEEKEWVDLLTKICQTNANRLQKYHPCAFINGQWLCCKSANVLAPGCTAVSVTDSNNFHMTLDPERDLQRMHSLVLTHALKLNQMYPSTNGTQLMHGVSKNSVTDLIDVTYSIEQKHRSYQRALARDTKLGSIAAPIGDDNYLLASRMNIEPALYSVIQNIP